MKEEEARRWLVDETHVPRETLEQLETFIAFLKVEMTEQNLISASSVEHIWARHIVDSAQLLSFAPSVKQGGKWLDLGSGAGFPGLIIAMMSEWEVVLVESRRLRAEYLERAVEFLGLGERVTVIGKRLENMDSFDAAVISARAFAPLERLLTVSYRFSTEKTSWLLPKGKNALQELESISPKWDAMFHVEHSITDENAGILVGNLAGKRRE